MGRGTMTGGRVLAAAVLAVLVAAVMPASAFASPDSYDPADDDISHATEIIVDGALQEHRFDVSGDVDWIKFWAVAGDTYRVSAWDWDDPAVLDPYLALYSWAGGTADYYYLTSHDNRKLYSTLAPHAPELTAEIVWTCPTTDYYYISIMDFGDAGVYQVQAQRVPGTVTTNTAHRVDAGDRYGVAKKVALEAAGGSWAHIDTVILASGLERSAADALAASSLAGGKDAPVLLVNQASPTHTLPYATKTAIQSIEAASPGVAIKYYIIGGKVSTPDWLITRVKSSCTGARNATFERLYGIDRYACAARIARELREEASVEGYAVPDTCFVANGETQAYFYDALVASPFAYCQQWPILLTRKAGAPSPTVAEEARSNYLDTFVVGDGAEVSNHVLTHDLPGSTRVGRPARTWYDRSEFARYFAEWANSNAGCGVLSFSVANRLPDALTGGTLAGSRGIPSPLLLTYDADYAHEETLDYVMNNRLYLTDYYLVGGIRSISSLAAADIAYNAGHTGP